MSLLTQFYDCGGGGSGGTVPAGAAPSGANNAIFVGVPGFFIPVNASFNVSYNHVLIPINGYAGVVDINNGTYRGVTLNNTSVTIGGIPNTCRFIYNNNSSIISLESTVNNNNLTGIYGTGNCGYVKFTGTSYSSFTTLSTDIGFIPTGGSVTTSTFQIRGAALTADSVNHLITSVFDNYLGTTGGVINLSTGTSAGTGALTAAAVTAVAGLVANTWTVTLNP